MFKEIKVDLNFSVIVKILFVISLGYAFFLLKNIFLLILTAIVLSSALSSAVFYVESKRILSRHPSRSISVFIVYFLILLLIFLIGYFIIPSFISDVHNLFQTLPSYLEENNIFTPESLENIDIVSSLIDLRGEKISFLAQNSFFNSLGQNITGIDYNILILILSFWSEFFDILLVLILSFYFTINRYGIQSFIRIITPSDKISYVLNLWERSQVKISSWIKGQVIVAFINGILTFTALSIFTDIENVFALAFISGLLTLVPVFGSSLAFFPAAVLGFISGGLNTVAIVAIIFIVIQLLENNFIAPLIVNKVVGINPIIVIVSLIIGASIAGFIGILLSIPLVSVLMVYVNDVLDIKNLEERKEEIDF